MELMLALSLSSALNWVYVALGLGLVIFFHELGHFAVAKWCNVYVERFSIGFGPVIWSFRKGETEYALSIIPFGGYVKMLGQDDMDPSQLSSEEIAEDPRAYSAKNVWQRMAIISAGVIMNILTAVLFLAYAYSAGIQEPTSVIGGVQPGFPAWTEGMEAGDKVVEINGRVVNSFLDLKKGVALSAGDLNFKMQRRNGEDYALTIVPDKKKLGRMIGASPATGLDTVAENDAKIEGAYKYTVAAEADVAIPLNSTIVKANGVAINDSFEFQQLLAEKRAEPLELVFKNIETEEEVTTTIAPQPFQELGIQVDIGRILALRKGSPAAEVGLKVGDKIMLVNGQDVGIAIDPLRLPDIFAAEHGKEVTVKVKREKAGGELEELEFKVVPENKPGWVETPVMSEIPLSVPSIGVAFNLTNRILKVREESPAAKAGVQVNDAISAVELYIPEGVEPDAAGDKAVSYNLENESQNWAHIFWEIQRFPARKIKLTYTRAQKPSTVEINTVAAKDWFVPSARGLILLPEYQTQQAESFGEAIVMGYHGTKNNVLDIYLTLRNLLTGELSVKNLRGPLGIASVSHSAASQGMPYLAWFLGLLSVNLAVLNFLPIPVLDGGHMVFLIWESVTRKRPSEKVVIAATYIGMMFILGLMVLVLYLDIFVHWLGL